MNAYKINNNSEICIYKNNNIMLIITVGIDSPMFYQQELKKIINENINTNNSKTVIFFDTFSCVREESKRFLKLDYYSTLQNFDYSSIKNVELSEIPRRFQHLITKFENKLYCY